MAEERLIDADKDKKYRIVKNADGEDELVVDESATPEETTTEEAFFDVPEVKEDNEEEAVMTPEQLAAKREREQKEREEMEKKRDELVAAAEKDCLLYRYATALEYLEKAGELDEECGEVYALRVIAYTKNFTDFSQVVPAAESAVGLKEYASEERKQKMREKGCAALEENIASLRATVNKMNDENEAKKAERAQKFLKDRKIAIIVFACLAACLVCFAALTGYYASVIYTVSNGLYLALTICFGVATLLELFATALAARRLNITCRRIKQNRRNSSTQLGRDLLKEQAKLKAFIAINSALKE